MVFNVLPADMITARRAERTEKNKTIGEGEKAEREREREREGGGGGQADRQTRHTKRHINKGRDKDTQRDK